MRSQGRLLGRLSEHMHHLNSIRALLTWCHDPLSMAERDKRRCEQMTQKDYVYESHSDLAHHYFFFSKHIVYPSPNCATYISHSAHETSSVHINAQLPQIDLGHFNLLHQLLVRIRNVVECEDAPAEAEEEERTKGNEGPEGEL